METSIRPVVRSANFFTPDQLRIWESREIPDFELILAVAGDMSYEDETGTAETVGEGTVLCIPPATTHTLTCRSEENTIACIHCELFPVGPWVTGAYELDVLPERVTYIRELALATELFRETARVYAGFSRLRETMLENLVRQIWLMLVEPQSGTGGGSISGRLHAMVDYLRRHRGDPVSRHDLGRVFGITPQHVNALFKKELGMTPTQVHHREKIFYAVQSIQKNGTPLKELAEELGFTDVSHFSRVFKKVMDFTPGKIR